MSSPLPHGQATATPTPTSTLRAGMVGLGMIFDETYRPFFEAVHRRPLYDPAFGITRVELAAVASRTGRRADEFRRRSAGRVADFVSFTEPDCVEQLLAPQQASNTAPVNPRRRRSISSASPRPTTGILPPPGPPCWPASTC